MLRSPALRHVAVAACAVVSLSCRDLTSPEPAGYALFNPTKTIVSAFALLDAQYEAKAVEWNVARPGDESVSALIGADGGTISLPSSDFAMHIPRGALTTPTHITVTSVAGPYVTYDMQPHGLQFSRPVTVVQHLRSAAAYGSNALDGVRSAYLSERNTRISETGSVAPAELEAAVTYFYGAQPVAETHVWTLNHFSRYILISGVWVVIQG